MNTRVCNNNFHISIGVVTSSLDKHDVVNSHNSALGSAVFDNMGGIPSDSYVPRQRDMGAGQPIRKITEEQVSEAVETITSTSVPQGGARRKIPLPPTCAHPHVPVPPPPRAPPTLRQTRSQEIQHLQSKELLRTLSSAMEKPYWDTCQKAGTDPCMMPNVGRTPDICVTVIPDNYTQNLTYPIFVGEILGTKEQPVITQRYAGYNATMQSLVFAPRAYY